MSGSRRQDPFSELFGELGDRVAGDRWRPFADVFETEKSVVVRLEIAGVSSADLRVIVHDDLLTIRGLRRVPSDAATQRLHQMEIAFGPFERSLRIGVPFEADAVSAHLEDGFLSVTLPKRLPASRKIDVENVDE